MEKFISNYSAFLKWMYDRHILFPAAVPRYGSSDKRRKEELTFIVVNGDDVLWSSKKDVYYFPLMRT